MVNKLEIKLNGPKGSPADRHRFTAEDIIDLVENTQKAVTRLATKIAGKDASDLRKVAKAFKQACTLEFGPIEKGSALLKAELTPITDAELDLFPNLKRAPSDALNQLTEIIQGASEARINGYSKQILENIKNLGKPVSRTEDSYLTFTVLNGSKREPVKYSRATYNYLSGATQEEEKEKLPMPLKGRLFEIDCKKHTGKIEADDEETKISFPEEMDNKLKVLLKTEVELSGVAELDKEGKIKKFEVEEITGHEKPSLFDNKKVEYQNEGKLTESMTITNMKYKSRKIKLLKQLNCVLTVEEGLFVISNDYLDITAFGDTREKAHESFAEDFFFLIDEYLHEEDENLYKGAKDLKRKLKALVGDEY